MRTKPELAVAIRQQRRTALVVNARSRRGRRLYEAALARLTQAGFELLGSYPVDRPDELETTISAATDLAPDLLVVGGGDGTISAAARLLAHRDIAFGVLPLGTTNNFARTIGVPLDLDAAVATLTDGNVIDVDLGIADEALFANHVGVGLSADIMLRSPWLLNGPTSTPNPIRGCSGIRLRAERHVHYAASAGSVSRSVRSDSTTDGRCSRSSRPRRTRPRQGRPFTAAKGGLSRGHVGIVRTEAPEHVGQPTGGDAMIRVPDDALAEYPQRARDELTAAWDHLVSAAEHGAKQVGRSSRRNSTIARKRAVRARRALRGESPTPWRWFGAGLAAGMIAGAAGTTALARRRHDSDQPPDHTAATGRWREQGSAATEAVRERAAAAAATARDTAAKLRKRAGKEPGEQPGEQPAPPPAGPAKPASASPGE